MVFEDALQVVQIIVAIALIAVIVLQGKGGGLNSLFGGGDAGGGIAKTRRGLEKTVFQITIVLSVIFIANAILQLLIQ
jgi:preprotein translocase subunit SecG